MSAVSVRILEQRLNRSGLVWVTEKTYLRAGHGTRRNSQTGMFIRLGYNIWQLWCGVAVTIVGSVLWPTASLAQAVDEVTGFREFAFGSSKEKLPGSLKEEFPSSTIPKWSTIDVPASEFKSATLFDHPIGHVVFSYWEGRLFRIRVYLQPVDAALPVVASSFHALSTPELVAWTKLRGALSDAYGKFDKDDSEILKGRFLSEWKGKKVGVTLYGWRDLSEKQNAFFTSFEVYLQSLTMEQAAEIEIEAQKRLDAARRTDGLN
ncbi:MAG: hypothetical protein JWM88_1854 [Verrucomicrobia bacterium]|nr:hypothetical protein [Verrucomicrobiota bacterium]